MMADFHACYNFSYLMVTMATIERLDADASSKKFTEGIRMIHHLNLFEI